VSAVESAATVVARVREQFQELTGLPAAMVSGLTRVEDGWQVMVDVVEVRRIPDTASVLATYRVGTGPSGDIAGYERVRRFSRSESAS